MKKLLLLLSMLILFSATVFAVESFWCLNATANVNSSGDHYRFNYSTVYDLSTYYSYNGHTTPQLGDYNKTNGLNEAKALGTVGVGGCDHAIEYTISTNGGKFVSQSDPSKYREFYVVNVPDYSVSGSAERKYFCLDSNGTGGNAPSTLNSTNSMTFTAPVTNGNVSAKIYNNYGNSSNVKCTSVGLDLFLCMAQLQNADLEHLSENDDYFATITVSWHCTTAGCTQNHTGTFDMVVRGYYGGNSGQARDTFLLIVNPAADVNTLDLKSMIKENQTKVISSMTIATTTKEGTSGSAYAWRDHIYAFLSASPDYMTTDYSGFVLTKMTNRSVTIPYTLTVYNTTSGSPMTGKVYDGTDHFIENDQSYCFDLRDYSKPNTDYYAMSYDRYGTYYYAINYTGRVDITLTNFTIPGTSVDLRTVMNDPVLYNDEYTRYIGKYESNIYYHIVYVD